jgi:hypothetical protein
MNIHDMNIHKYAFKECCEYANPTGPVKALCARFEVGLFFSPSSVVYALLMKRMFEIVLQAYDEVGNHQVLEERDFCTSTLNKKDL